MDRKLEVSYAPNSYDEFHDNLSPCKIEQF